MNSAMKLTKPIGMQVKWQRIELTIEWREMFTFEHTIMKTICLISTV